MALPAGIGTHTGSLLRGFSLPQKLTAQRQRARARRFSPNHICAREGGDSWPNNVHHSLCTDKYDSISYESLILIYLLSSLRQAAHAFLVDALIVPACLKNQSYRDASQRLHTPHECLQRGLFAEFMLESAIASSVQASTFACTHVAQLCFSSTPF